jgi:hypothetical protein
MNRNSLMIFTTKTHLQQPPKKNPFTKAGNAFPPAPIRLLYQPRASEKERPASCPTSLSYEIARLHSLNLFKYEDIGFQALSNLKGPNAVSAPKTAKSSGFASWAKEMRLTLLRSQRKWPQRYLS